MDLSTILEFIVTFVGGGALASLFTLKQQKESKDLDNAAKVVQQYTILLDRAEKANITAHQQIEELTRKVSDLEKECAVMRQQLETCQLLYKQAATLRCDKLNCPHRQPPLDRDTLEHLGNIDDDNE